MAKGLYIWFIGKITMKQELKLKYKWEKVCHDIEEHIKDPEYAKALDEFIRLTS